MRQRSINPFPKPDPIDKIIVAICIFGLVVSPFILAWFGGATLIFWFLGLAVLNIGQSILWYLIKKLRGIPDEDD